jgi:hypothetical protein
MSLPVYPNYPPKGPLPLPPLQEEMIRGAKLKELAYKYAPKTIIMSSSTAAEQQRAVKMLMTWYEINLPHDVVPPYDIIGIFETYEDMISAFGERPKSWFVGRYCLVRNTEEPDEPDAYSLFKII